MAYDKSNEKSVEKRDLVHIVILMAIGLSIGVYLIATTVLIAKDGVFYIELAQKFSSDPVFLKAHAPGYPFLIFAAHKLVTLFSNSSSVQVWIYSAQGVTLLCRLFTLIPLYFIGKFLIGSKKSFWAILILVMLPYPTKFGSDVLREWPYILFLAGGFLFLLAGANQGKWWMFGVVGLAAGLGHIIRPECAQLVAYGGLWLVWSLARPKRGMTRVKLALELVVLVTSFCILTGPYMRIRGKILPERVEVLIGSAQGLQSDEVTASRVDKASDGKYVAAVALTNVVKAFGKLTNRISQNLMYFFVPALLIGLYYYFRKQPKGTKGFFVAALILFNVTILVLLYCNDDYISRRHALPLVVMTIFYVPNGLQVISDLLTGGTSSNGNKTNTEKVQFWFFVMSAVGMLICMPKLFRPMCIKKQGYREAAKWLNENTLEDAIIAVPDRRISFYAKREGLIYDKKVPKQARYVVRIVKNGSEPKFGRTMQKRHSVWVNKRGSGKKITIYEML